MIETCSSSGEQDEGMHKAHVKLRLERRVTMLSYCQVNEIALINDSCQEKEITVCNKKTNSLFE